MSIHCGLVGLPNAGKSTIFNALSRGGAEVGNFPFCTIQPNQCLTPVPDERLHTIARVFSSQKQIPAMMEFVDIAGLVEGASKGEGMGNQFLAHIRNASVVLHVLRCFDDEDVVHIKGGVDPLRDREIVDTELLLADMESVQRRLEKMKKKRHAEKEKEYRCMEEILTHLEKGEALRSFSFPEDLVWMQRDFFSAKPVLYICNVSENMTDYERAHVQDLKKQLGDTERVLELAGKLEADIAALNDAEERSLFLKEMRIQEPGLNKLIREAYGLLGLGTFFTAGVNETRAWSFTQGSWALDAADLIHSDFKKGFICADVYHYEDLMEHPSEKELKAAGKIRREGKEYLVRDGDIIFFRWNL